MSHDDDPDESDEADPFEDLEDAVGDRSGDPFEGLGVDTAGRDANGSDNATAEPGDGTGTEPPGPQDGPKAGGRWPSMAGDGSANSELTADDEPAEETEVRDEAVDTIDSDVGPDDELSEDDPFSAASPDFEEVDLEGLDEDEVWEALSAARAAGSVADVQEHTYAEVSKHTYCEQCEYFTGPPEVTCTHDGTRIVEFVDMETVRVLDCPVVAERRRLEREH